MLVCNMAALIKKKKHKQKSHWFSSVWRNDTIDEHTNWNKTKIILKWFNMFYVYWLKYESHQIHHSTEWKCPHDLLWTVSYLTLGEFYILLFATMLNVFRFSFQFKFEPMTLFHIDIINFHLLLKAYSRILFVKKKLQHS